MMKQEFYKIGALRPGKNLEFSGKLEFGLFSADGETTCYCESDVSITTGPTMSGCLRKELVSKLEEYTRIQQEG